MEIQKPSLSTIIVGLVLAVYIGVSYWLLPDELPLVLQLLLAAGCVALTMTLYAMATKPGGRSSAVGAVLARGQHQDFGRQVRASRTKKQASLNLPILGETTVRFLVGLGLFAIVTGWWFTPWAPVEIKGRELGDLPSALSEEIESAVLVLPDGKIAVLQPPVADPKLREHVALIEDEGLDKFSLAYKSIIEGNHVRARVLLDEVAEVDKKDVLLAKAHNEMFALQFADAAKIYDEALEASPEDVSLLTQAAIAHLHMGHLDKAEELIDAAMELRESKANDEDLQFAAVLHAKVLLLVGRGDFDAAAEINGKARDIRRNAFADEHPLIGASANNQAVLGMLLARYSVAKAALPEARDNWKRVVGVNHPRVGASLANEAMLNLALGRLGKARELSDKAGEVYEHSLPPEHVVAAVDFAVRSAVSLAEGRLQQAQDEAQKALTTAEKKTKQSNPLSAPVANTVANAYTAQSNYVEAEPYYLRARLIASNLFGIHHPYMAVATANLANLYVLQGRYSIAESACDLALKISEETNGRSHPLTAAILDTRGELEIGRGEPRRARGYLRESRDIIKGVLEREEDEGRNEGHPALVRVEGNLASLDQDAVGAAAFRKIIGAAQDTLGPEHPEFARLVRGLAVNLTKQREFDEAEKQFRLALSIQEKALPSYHPELAKTLEEYAEMLIAADPQNADRAQKLKDRAKAIRTKHAEKNAQD